METQPDKSFGGKLAAFAGSTALAIIALSLIGAYLGLVSVLMQLAPQTLQRVLGRSDTALYSHWLLVALICLLCFNLICASLQRVRPDLPRLGAWCSHLGILVLTAGASWYALSAVRGECLTTLATPETQSPAPHAGHWTPIESFYVENTFALHARYNDSDRTRWEPIEGLMPKQDKTFNATLACPFPDVTVQVTRYLAGAALTQEAPQALLRVTDKTTHDVVVSPFYEGEGYAIVYHPDASQQTLDKMLRPPPPNVGNNNILVILAGQLKPTLVVLGSDRKVTSQELTPDKEQTVRLPNMELRLQLKGLTQRAGFSLAATKADPHKDQQATAAIEVKITSGQWQYLTFLPYQPFADFGEPLDVPLPGGRRVGLIFSRIPQSLPARVQVTRTEFKAYPGSNVAQDFICDVDIDAHGRTSAGQIRLNNPLQLGPYQLSQGSWQPGGPQVQQIVLGVASRPGVWLVYVGFVLICAGFPWAFYVKPAILRRRAAKAAATNPPAPPTPSPSPKTPPSGPTTLAVLLLVATLLLSCASPALAADNELLTPATADFLRKVDSAALSRLGVQYEGRTAILDTLCRDHLTTIYGRDSVQNLPPTAVFLELYFNSGAYIDRPVLFVKERQMQAALAKAMDAQQKAAFEASHRIAPACLMSKDAEWFLVQAKRATQDDFIRAQRVPVLDDALAAIAEQDQFRLPLEKLETRYSSFLGEDLMLLIPRRDGQWQTPDSVLLSSRVPLMPPASLPALSVVPASLPANPTTACASDLAALADAWRSRDAQKANQLIATLAIALPQLARDANQPYPTPALVTAELAYNRTYKATAVWIGFAFAMILLLIATAHGTTSGRLWRRLGMAMLVLSTTALLAGFAVRWLLGGRSWYLPPIMNQFEAVVAAALFAAILAIVLELFTRRNYYGLSAAFYATVSLLAAFFLPEQMGAGITAPRGILASPIMAIHVAVIIIGHALVGMAFFISLVYLAVRIRQVGKDVVAAVQLLPDSQTADTTDTLAVIDRCNLIVVQLATWTVILGTILGAYWADFAWGRWWGWDAKEVWALITAIILLIILHVRFVMPPHKRGLITALLCILATAIMLFNWIVVNYFLTGMHSYA